MSSIYTDLLDLITKRRARTGVVGLGYVGLPLAVELGRAGFETVGIDLDEKKVAAVNRGESYIPDVAGELVAQLVRDKRLSATTDFGVVETLDTVNICVPTPLRKTKDPDLSYVVSAVEQIAAHLHPGVLVVLESTTSQTSMPSRSHIIASSLTSPMFTARKVFSSSFTISATRVELTGTIVSIAAP